MMVMVVEETMMMMMVVERWMTGPTTFLALTSMGETFCPVVK